MITVLGECVMSLSESNEEKLIDYTTNSDNYKSLIVQEIIGEIGFDFIKEVRAMPKLRTCLD